MKKYLLQIGFIVLSVSAIGQTNTFPSSGNVGIGTTSPGSPLVIYNNTVSSPELTVYDYATYSSGGNGIALYNNFSNANSRNWGMLQGSTIYGDFSIVQSNAQGGNPFSAGTSRLYINNIGNVGIGTISPLVRLQITSTGFIPQMTLGSNNGVGLGLTSPDGLQYGLYAGVYNDGSSWLQGGRTDMATAYNISLQASGGNLGVGTTSPQERLQIKSTGFIPQMTLGSNNGIGFGLTSPDGLQYGLYAGVYNDGSTWLQGGRTDMATAYNISLQASGGNVGIGTTHPTQLLSVAGNIQSKKLIVTQTGWSDYVFKSAYKLKPLSEVAAFIKTNKHLPDVPTEKEVANAGIDVGATEALLLKKIEELTLYMIDQQKQINALKRKLENNLKNQ